MEVRGPASLAGSPGVASCAPGGLSTVRYICNFQGSSEPIYFLRLFFHRSLDTTGFASIEAAYYHQPHLKRSSRITGIECLAVMLVCNGKIFNYEMILYDKSKSKIQLVQDIADELPTAPTLSYFLCDSWYTSVDIMESFIKKGFYTIGALRTNRILYPKGIREAKQAKLKLSSLPILPTSWPLVIKWIYMALWGKAQWHYKCCRIAKLFEKMHLVKNSCRCSFQRMLIFQTQDILEIYVSRWPIEVFFRSSKSKLGLSLIKSGVKSWCVLANHVINALLMLHLQRGILFMKHFHKLY